MLICSKALIQVFQKLKKMLLLRKRYNYNHIHSLVTQVSKMKLYKTNKISSVKEQRNVEKFHHSEKKVNFQLLNYTINALLQLKKSESFKKFTGNKIKLNKKKSDFKRTLPIVELDDEYKLKTFTVNCIFCILVKKSHSKVKKCIWFIKVGIFEEEYNFVYLLSIRVLLMIYLFSRITSELIQTLDISIKQ